MVDDMRIVMTLMVRDEADIIERQIDFHRAAGVDFFIVTDHESRDGTSEILERYAADGILHRIPVVSPAKRQAEWVTRMARLAATDFGADWVINSDADEFWWPWGGDLKEVLGSIPERYGVLQTFVRAFLPRAGEGDFGERLTVRFAPAAPINSPFSPFRVNVRLLHRSAVDIVVGRGNATVKTAYRPLPGWSPVEVLHVPIRSFAQFEHKVPDALRGVRRTAPRRARACVRGVARRPVGRAVRRDLRR